MTSFFLNNSFSTSKHYAKLNFTWYGNLQTYTLFDNGNKGIGLIPIGAYQTRVDIMMDLLLLWDKLFISYVIRQTELIFQAKVTNFGV